MNILDGQQDQLQQLPLQKEEEITNFLFYSLKSEGKDIYYFRTA